MTGRSARQSTDFANNRPNQPARTPRAFLRLHMNITVTGDCRETMRAWAADGVRAQMCVTSPPYFGLRSYMPDAVKLRGDIDPEKLASVLKELDSLGIGPCAHTSE